MAGEVKGADEIVRLPEHVANQIAAGEVVQRPASVAKELLENAIDAGATVISLDVIDAGKQQVCVADNGRGMGEGDAQRCFERHATSKISSADDLLSLVTKGFRGEALSSIASVAQVTLKTRRSEDALGWEVRADGGEVMPPQACTAEMGARMEVRNLFFNVPARRNFLKSDAVEMRHLIDEFHRVALPHPEVSFVMRNGGKELFNLPAGAMRQRVVHIFGSRYDQRLVPVEESTDVVSLSGFVGKPEFAKRTRGEQFLFVNGRFIKHPAFHSSILRAMDGLLSPGKFPFYTLFLEVEPSRIDVNIHPTKVEANFAEQREIAAIIGAAVKRALGRFQVAPALDFDQEMAFTITPPRPGSVVAEPQIRVNKDFNPFDTPSASPSSGTSSLRSDRALQPDRIEATRQFFEPSTGGLDSPPMFQLYDRWIVTTLRADLILIDQHRAHARVLLEAYAERWGPADDRPGSTAAPSSQQLLFPANVQCSPGHADIILEHLELFRGFGLDLEHLGGSDFVVSGVPADALGFGNPADPQELVESILAELDEADVLDGDELKLRAATGLAGKSAIRNGRSLSEVEMRDLVDRLFACEEPGRDPWGRPTMSTFDRAALEPLFSGA